MYRISELAKRVGLSRSTLLYYEKLGLIAGKRLSNGYRSYSEQDYQRIKLLQQLQAAGLTLKECLSCLEGQIDRNLLTKRLNTLETEIAEKQSAQVLLLSMLGKSSMRDWHETIERSAPSAHLDWLTKQGFDEKSALRIKWLSKDMNKHEQYMNEFEVVFGELERLGPGDSRDSLKALHSVPIQSGKLLEIGCGKGITAKELAKNSSFSITALDDDKRNLQALIEGISGTNIEQQIVTVCASMTAMPFNKQEFDVIWSEGSAYIMGFKQALKYWQAYLKPKGYMVITDLVWLTDDRDKEAVEFWLNNYPDMVSVKQRTKDIVKSGYEVISSFTQSEQSWANYLLPLKIKINEVGKQLFTSNLISDLKAELTIHDNYLGQYGYQVFVVKSKSKSKK